jgi:D-sedoheptulose 7-phosphate isomerase
MTFKNKDFNLNSFYASEFQEHLQVAQNTLEAVREPFEDLLKQCVKAIESGNKILFFGNGGSAADAQHLATELVVRYRHNRIPIAALALTTDTSALTAIGNDLGFDQLFARQIEALGQKGDVAIAITTSGKSRNITLGLQAAIKKGIVPAVLTGKGGGELHGIANPMLIVPSNTTARIQEMHIMVGQMLCDALEKALGIPTFPA